MGDKRFFGRKAQGFGLDLSNLAVSRVRGQASERHGSLRARGRSNGGRSFRNGRKVGESKVERAEKRELVSTLNTVFKSAGVVVVAHNNGITVSQMNDLRGRMRKAGAAVKVAKNRLAMLALDGTDVSGIKDLFKGPTMIAYSSDPVAAPKIVTEFAKAHEKLVVLGGALGASMLDAKGVKELADLPSLDQLRAKLVGLLQAPATRIAGVLQAPAAQLARVFDAYANKNNAA
jgi:large subunit ribosomal protein L10